MVGGYVQLQQGEVGVAVVRLPLALGHHIVLEDARRLRVVAVQSIEDLVDVLGPVLGLVEGTRHGVEVDVRQFLGGERDEEFDCGLLTQQGLRMLR